MEAVLAKPIIHVTLNNTAKYLSVLVHAQKFKTIVQNDLGSILDIILSVDFCDTKLYTIQFIPFPIPAYAWFTIDLSPKFIHTIIQNS